MDGCFATYSCPASPTFLCQFRQSQRCCWRYISFRCTSLGTPSSSGGGASEGTHGAMDRTFPGLQGRADGSEINRSDASDGNGLNKTNRLGFSEESGLPSITQACIKCDIVKQAAKWPTMTRLELEWQRSLKQSG